MPTTNLTQRVQQITGVNDASLALLTVQGIINEEDLSFLEFVDLPATIPIFHRRKLNLISHYLSQRHALTATYTILTVQARIAQGHVANTSVGCGLPPDPDQGVLKVHTNHLPDFSGDAVDFEEWEMKAGAIIKQSIYSGFIHKAAAVGNATKEIVPFLCRRWVCFEHH